MKVPKIVKTIVKDAHYLHRDLELLVKHPKEYLYSFHYSNSDRVVIEKYDPRVHAFGEKLVREIHQTLPKLKIHFIGSAALGLPGQKDIDLLAECKPADFDKYLPGLISIFGQPSKHRESFVEWGTDLNGYSVDLVMCDPKNEILAGPLDIFNILKGNHKLLKQYEEIKLSANHVSSREYKRRRLVFFNKLREEAAN